VDTAEGPHGWRRIGTRTKVLAYARSTPVGRRGPSGVELLGNRNIVARLPHQRWYHTFVEKTTIYLSIELKSAIKLVARRRGVSEAEVIRDSIRSAVGDERPRSRGGLFASGAPIARRADDHLTGFGEP
jgi:hypothetical protein